MRFGGKCRINKLKISAIMKNIRLCWRILHRLILTLLVVASGQVLCAATPVVMNKGKVTLQIERKIISRQDAQNFINNHTPIPLRVSLIFEGDDMVKYIQEKNDMYFSASSFSFGLAQSEGNDKTSAPLEMNNPLAYIYGSKCTVDGISLEFPRDLTSYTSPTGADYCPRPHAYMVTIDRNTSYSASIPYSTNLKETTINGKTAYVLEFFNLYFGLKPDFLNNPNLYVRGIDINNSDMESTDDQTTLISSPGTTELNLLANSDGSAVTWPNGESVNATDWTQSGSTKYGQNGQIETDYYGGVIPGGIFIEQVPELTQFEP